jgi:hypothetical protein
MHRNCVYVDYLAITDVEAKADVRTFMFEYIIQNPNSIRRAGTDVFDSNELFIFDLQHDYSNFRGKFTAFADQQPAAKFVHHFTASYPEPRVMVNNDKANGLHVLVRPGDTVSCLGHSSKLGVQDHGYYPASLPPKGRYIGEIAKLWVAGSSHAVWKATKMLRYELTRERAGMAHWCIEDALELAAKKLGDYAEIGILSKRGDLYRITSTGVKVNEYADDAQILEAYAWRFQIFKTDRVSNCISKEKHCLSPFHQALRGAAHMSAIQRNEAGFI